MEPDRDDSEDWEDEPPRVRVYQVRLDGFDVVSNHTSIQEALDDLHELLTSEGSSEEGMVLTITVTSLTMEEYQALPTAYEIDLG